MTAMGNVPLTVLGLAASPRYGGNTEQLLDAFLEGARDAGARIEKIRLADLEIAPCIACEDCYTDGECCFDDDAAGMYEKLANADVIVLATPVYFYSVTTQAKLLIDRCQTLWARKTLLDRPAPAARRRGVLFSAAATGGRRLFEGVELTARYWMDTFHCDLIARREYRGLESGGDVGGCPALIADARELGRCVAGNPDFREEA